MWAAQKLLTTRFLLTTSNLALKQSRATFIKGLWPEPLTQQTLEQFLADIDYFERPTEFIDVGLRLGQANEGEAIAEEVDGSKVNDGSSQSDGDRTAMANVDQLLDNLGENHEMPPLNIDDAALSHEQLKNLAINHGIYRDLFHDFVPRRDQIKFLPEQAQRMSKLVPHYWISDQPFARADRHLKKTEPLYCFEPLVRISARFVYDIAGEEAKYAHSAYHGNIIPASEAAIKPSITLDGRRLSTPRQPAQKPVNESQYDNWLSGHLSCENFAEVSGYHTLVMLNLDSIHANCANLHWMLTNIEYWKENGKVTHEEVCDYLPVHGIRGFGHSRYVFLLLRHESKLDSGDLIIKGFSPSSRKFDVKRFMDRFSSYVMTPVGLSWFQTSWDHSSNQVFHDYMGLQAPVYEVVQEKLAKRDLLDKAYPGRVPFNIFMDHYTDPKQINERVLLERLKNINPYDYKDQYVQPKVPPTVFQDENIPSWMNSVMFKKNNRLGYWRGLRPASATIPLNNNADLDYPIKPIGSTRKSPPGYPNIYPAKPKMKLLKDLPYNKPANEHKNVYIMDDHEIYLDKAHDMMKSLKQNEIKK